MKKVNLLNNVEEAAQMLNDRVSRRLMFVNEFEGEIPWIEGDQATFQQTLARLIRILADEKKDEQGKIQVMIGLTDASSECLTECRISKSLGDGTYVFVEVSDWDCSIEGIEQSVQRKIFYPFMIMKFSGRCHLLPVGQGCNKEHDGVLHVVTSRCPGVPTFRILMPIKVMGAKFTP